MSNQCTAIASPLADSPSPYLQQHADDPTEWQLWGREALHQAEEKKRLILLSSGYFACHWCHVMQQESFRNRKIAAIINRAFIPVKVDRELNPTLDRDLIDFTQRTAGRAGWPLQVILTPDGTPLLGFVYLPPDELKTLLLQLERRWRDDPAAMMKLAHDVVQQLQQGSREVMGESGEPTIEAFLTGADLLSGGFGAQSKFPGVPHLLTGMTLLQQQSREGEPHDELYDFLITTLDSMATRGLHDPIDGGFFRYTIDPDWSTPHFEKMLYDNAQLALLYLRAGRLFQREDYLGVGYETLGFMVERMSDGDGMFIASLSAVDDAGIEGGYYLLDPDEIRRALSDEEWGLFQRLWYPNRTELEGRIHLFLPDLNSATGKHRGLILSIREKLRQLRTLHRLPRDTKVLSGWNGLVLSALAEALSTGHRGEHRRIGNQLAQSLLSRQWKGGELLRLLQQGSAAPAALEDYAYVAEGLHAWGSETENRELLLTAEEIVRAAERAFYINGEWRQSANRLLRYRSPVSIHTEGEPLPPAVTVLQSMQQRLARSSQQP